MLVYLLCVLFLCIPAMLAEMMIGRRARHNAAGAFRTIAPGTWWPLVGYTGILGAFLILGYYNVIAGWTLEYIWQAATGGLTGKSTAQYENDFLLFHTGTMRPILWTWVFVAMTHSIVVSGVKNGIERFSKIMMPTLFVIIIMLCIRAVTLPGSGAGLHFLFWPDFSKIGPSALLSAMGQSFFSLSLGMGCLITYGSYFKREDNLQTTVLWVTLLDTSIAIMAGIVIFPAAFSFGIEPAAGPSLAFITLPNIFQHLPIGQLWSLLFFILLGIAALTSTISLHEVVTAYLHEEWKLSRTKAATLVTAGILVLSACCSLSFGVLKEVTFFQMTLFDALDFLTAKLMMPLGGMCTCIFVGWRIDRNILYSEVTNEGTITFYFFRVYVFFLKYFAPVAIGLIFLNGLQLF